MSDTENPFGVRRAKPHDIEALMAFVPIVLVETTVLPLSDAKVRRLVSCCANQQGGMAGIIDGDDGIDASIGLVLTEALTSDVPYITAAWCGLHPNVRKQPANPNDPRGHYGSRLFQFVKWCHQMLEAASGKSIMVRFDLETREFLMPKIGLYQRNLPQIGAYFALGAAGDFVPQPVPAEAAA